MLPMKVWDEQEKRMWFVQSLHIEDEWIRANDGSITFVHLALYV